MERSVRGTFVLVSLFMALIAAVGCGSEGATPISSPNLSTLGADLAPTYEEIQRGINTIVRTPYPEGVPVGLDGIEDKQLEEHIRAYSDSLEGKHVLDWHGWHLYNDVQQDDEATASYRVAILMHEPLPGAEYDPDLYLFLEAVPADVSALLNSLGYGEPITFSGILLGVDAFGFVGVEKGTISFSK